MNFQFKLISSVQINEEKSPLILSYICIQVIKIVLNLNET